MSKRERERESASKTTKSESKAGKRDDEMQGEGNKDADRRYRRGVKETVESTTEKERAERARELAGEDEDAAHNAEAKGRARARR